MWEHERNVQVFHPAILFLLIVPFLYFWCDLEVAVTLKEMTAFAVVQSEYVVRLVEQYGSWSNSEYRIRWFDVQLWMLSYIYRGIRKAWDWQLFSLQCILLRILHISAKLMLYFEPSVPFPLWLTLNYLGIDSSLVLFS